METDGRSSRDLGPFAQAGRDPAVTHPPAESSAQSSWPGYRIFLNAARARSPASGSVPVYCWVVVMRRCPSRSWTTMMSAPPARSQEAWAARRLWKVTFWSTLALVTADVQYLVRKLFRDSAVPAVEVKSRSSSRTV